MPLRFTIDDKALGEAIVRQDRALTEALIGGAKAATKAVELAASRRVKTPRKQTNIQDTPTRVSVRAKPLRSYVDGQVGYVELRSHRTPARTPAIKSLFARFGLFRTLRRRGLWIAPPKSGMRSKAGYSSRAGLQFFPFSDPRNRRLVQFAEKPGRGLHVLKNTVMLRDPNVRMELVLKPALQRTLGQIKSAYETRIQDAVQKGGKR